MTSPEKRHEIEQNYCVFLDKLPFILPMYRDQYALMRQGEIVGYYSTLQDAYITGQKFYEDKLYSIQKVTDIPVVIFQHQEIMRSIGVPPAVTPLNLQQPDLLRQVRSITTYGIHQEPLEAWNAAYAELV